jgi:hexosaminidase
MLRLEQCHLPEPADQNGSLRLRVYNVGETSVPVERLFYTSLMRPVKGAVVRGGRFVRRFANHVEIAAEADFEIAPGAYWEITVAGLNLTPKNRTFGALSAWVEHKDTVTDCHVAGLDRPEHMERSPVKTWPDPKLEAPICLVPWPAEFAVLGMGPAVMLRPADPAQAAEFVNLGALHKRLFPASADIVTLGEHTDAVPVRCVLGDCPTDGYHIAFGDEITLTHADANGLQHGLVALGQMAHAALSDPRFRFPKSGHISDAPRHEWRGMHLDVSRNFITAEGVARMIDILAWHRMNRLHWHLTDDEAWRLEIEGLPELTEIGSKRAHGTVLPPQFAEGSKGQSGYYTADQVRNLVAHGQSLGVEIMPEIDLPGHCTALLAALPHLADPDETAESYHSVQGYPNNAINPGIPETWPVLEKIFAAVAELFPYAYLHLGGDEVDADSWSTSPKARAWAAQKHVQAGAATIQSAFMRDCQDMLSQHNRKLGGWDECADGGGVDTTALLFAWRSREKIAALMEDGYHVVATPGQHYYLDMAQGTGWDNPGLTWAGISPLQDAYEYEADLGLPSDKGKLVGLQACMWSELIDGAPRFNYMAFPRLSAVAEAAWTPSEEKDWPRFATLSRLMPHL